MKGGKQMILGYARVSTDGQDLSSQRKALKAAGCEKVYEEKLSGARMKDRPQLQRLIKATGDGDTVIVSAVDRLSRETTDLLIIARDLRVSGASLRSLAEPIIDTGSEIGDVFLALLGILASMERGKNQGEDGAWSR
jgi:DNA invertase Pin-like site-specific DNA recombinase